MPGIFDTGIFDTGIFDHAAVAPVVAEPIGGGGYWPVVKRPEYRIHPEYDDEEKPKPKRKRRKKVRKEEEQIVLAPDPVIETGIVTVRPAWDAMAELQRIADEAALEQRNRLMALLRADDEWLMSL